jgi:hypothetical protein
MLSIGAPRMRLRGWMHSRDHPPCGCRGDALGVYLDVFGRGVPNVVAGSVGRFRPILRQS